MYLHEFFFIIENLIISLAYKHKVSDYTNASK